MLEADEHTLEDLQALALARHRLRVAETIRLAAGIGCAFAGGDAWKKWHRQAMDELNRS